MFGFNALIHVLVAVLWMVYGSRASDQETQTFEVPLTKIRNNYYGYIRVGTPLEEGGEDQIFRVNFDTGSMHLWLITTEGCSKLDCTGESFTPYNKTKSSTYTKIESRPFTLAYGDGTEVSGHLGYDVVKIGEKGKRAVFKQAIGFASSAKGVIKDYDGIFGLGLLTESLFPGKNPPKPPMWTMNDEYDISEFSIYFTRLPGGNGVGKVLFGGYDHTLAREPLHIHRVVKEGADYTGFNIKFDKIIVEKGSYKREILTEHKVALLDSGNNVIMGPKEIFDDIRDDIYRHAAFDYKKTVKRSFDCKADISVLPNIIFVMNGQHYKMDPKEYLWVFSSGRTCAVGIFGHNIDHVVLGQIFMETFYTHFNIGDQTVGIARAKKNS